MRAAAFAAFGVAAVAGLVLAATTAWWLVAVGLVCVLAAWFYTGGSRPYGYLGLGEVMVFVFFGLVAVVGTTYVQTETFEWAALYAAVGVGALACAILVANNLRDIPTDVEAGKRTLAVKLGPERTRGLYALLVLAAALAVVAVAAATTWWALRRARASCCGWCPRCAPSSAVPSGRRWCRCSSRPASASCCGRCWSPYPSSSPDRRPGTPVHLPPADRALRALPPADRAFLCSWTPHAARNRRGRRPSCARNARRP